MLSKQSHIKWYFRHGAILNGSLDIPHLCEGSTQQELYICNVPSVCGIFPRHCFVFGGAASCFVDLH